MSRGTFWAFPLVTSVGSDEEPTPAHWKLNIKPRCTLLEWRANQGGTQRPTKWRALIPFGKTTAIYFDEYNDLIEVQTHNTELKKRLNKFAAIYPDHCRQTDDDEQGGLTFEIAKGRLSFRLTAPYSAERRKIYSKNAKEKGVKGYAKHQEKH